MKIAVAGTGYVGMSIATLLAQPFDSIGNNTCLTHITFPFWVQI